MPEPSSLTDIHGRPIAGADLKRAMRVNICAGAFGMIWMQMSVGMPLTMFLEAVGASGKVIGTLTTVRLFALIAQIPGAFFAERLSSRKTFWAVLTLTHRGLWFLAAAIALFAAPSDPWVAIAAVIVVCVSDIFGNLGGSAWLSWMTELIPTKGAGRFWGVRQSIVTGVSLAGMGLSGVLLDLFRNGPNGHVSMTGFGVVFTIAAVMGVSDILIHLAVKEPMPGPKERSLPLFSRLLSPLRDRNFRLLTFAIAGWSFAAAATGSFWMIYLKRDYGVSYSHLSTIGISGSLGAVFSGYVFGNLIDRLGARTFAALMFLLVPLPALPWLLIRPEWVHIGSLWIPQSILVLAVSSFFGGSLASSIGLCQMRLLGSLSPESGRTMAMAVHIATVGLIAAIAPLLGGWVMDWFAMHPVVWKLPTGPYFSFFHIILACHILIIWTVALPLMLAIHAPKEEIPLGTAVSQMVMTNPMQVVRNLYNMHIIAARTSQSQKVEAARKLGASKSEIAVPDLIEKLDDPSLTVQEQAIVALGEIGSAPAVEALVHKLEDPEDHLAPEVVRALRHAANPIAADALLKRLHTGERETLAETVRALGAIGEQRAVPRLFEMIKHPPDARVLAAAGEALASMEQLDAAWQLIPQMCALPNRMLKRALAVAIGDLLGDKEGYYKMLVQESATADAGLDAVFARLEKGIRRKFPESDLVDPVQALRDALVAQDLDRAAHGLFTIGWELISQLSGLPGEMPANEAVEQLAPRHQRLALIVWLLDLLKSPWDSGSGDLRDRNDLLLGMYLVAELATQGKP